MYIYYNPNPLKLSVGDCTIRAISKVTYQTWEDTYLDLIHQGLTMYDGLYEKTRCKRRVFLFAHKYEVDSTKFHLFKGNRLGKGG